jgi:hypothetical protein
MKSRTSENLYLLRIHSVFTWSYTSHKGSSESGMCYTKTLELRLMLISKPKIYLLYITRKLKAHTNLIITFPACCHSSYSTQ